MDKGGKYADLKDVIVLAVTDYVMLPEKNEFISNRRVLTLKQIKTAYKHYRLLSSNCQSTRKKRMVLVKP